MNKVHTEIIIDTKTLESLMSDLSDAPIESALKLFDIPPNSTIEKVWNDAKGLHIFYATLEPGAAPKLSIGVG